MMGPLDAIKTGFAKSFQFSGRASRAEFWWFYLMVALVTLLLPIVDSYLFQRPSWEPTRSFWPATDSLSILSSLPMAAVGARRLHDLSLPGWPAILVNIVFVAWVVTGWGESSIATISAVGIISVTLNCALLIAALFPSRAGTNLHGPNPVEVAQ